MLRAWVHRWRERKARKKEEAEGTAAAASGAKPTKRSSVKAVLLGNLRRARGSVRPRRTSLPAARWLPVGCPLAALWLAVEATS